MNTQPYMWKFNFPLTLFLAFTHKPIFFCIYWTQNRLSWGGERYNSWHTLYISSMSCSNRGSSRTCLFMSFTLSDLRWAQCAKVVWLLKIERVSSAEHLKRFSYLQTFPEQGHISSPLLDQQSSKWGLWSVLTASFEGGRQWRRRSCELDKQGKHREREKGRGLCLMKAWLSVYYKLKILPSLVCSRHEEGGGGGGAVYICASVAPNPAAGGWERVPHRCGGNNRWTRMRVVPCLYCTYVWVCVCVLT